MYHVFHPHIAAQPGAGNTPLFVGALTGITNKNRVAFQKTGKHNVTASRLNAPHDTRSTSAGKQLRFVYNCLMMKLLMKKHAIPPNHLKTVVQWLAMLNLPDCPER